MSGHSAESSTPNLSDEGIQQDLLACKQQQATHSHSHAPAHGPAGGSDTRVIAVCFRASSAAPRAKLSSVSPGLFLVLYMLYISFKPNSSAVKKKL